LGPTVASNNQELILFCDFVTSNVGISGDDLALRGEGVVLLELEVTKGSGESEVAFDNISLDARHE
jgi:hypothetical protein